MGLQFMEGFWLQVDCVGHMDDTNLGPKVVEDVAADDSTLVRVGAGLDLHLRESVSNRSEDVHDCFLKREGVHATCMTIHPVTKMYKHRLVVTEELEFLI